MNKELFNFSEALELLKKGAKLQRKNWNGKNMFIWMKPGTIVKSDLCHDEVLKKIADDNGGEIEALPCICLKSSDNKIVSGWVASQTDIMANDWVIY